MECDGIRLRWINYCCYEIRLPDGKVILLDPCINTNREEIKDFRSEDFTGADYILLSHTHYDHTADLEYVAKKFHSKVFVGAMSAMAEAEASDLDLNQIYPVIPGDVYELPDFTLEVFRGKHTFLKKPGNTVEGWLRGEATEFPDKHRQANACGSVEYTDYLITTKENVRIFINGGGAYESAYFNALSTMKEKAPDIVIRQATSKYSIPEFAKVMNQFHCQVILPEHQDNFVKKTGMTCQEWAQALTEELKKLGSHTVVYAPEQYKWFEIYTGIRLV